MPDLTRAEIEALATHKTDHAPTVRPTHCDVCGLRWPCDSAVEADMISTLARQLLDALDRIEALESDRGPWRPDGGTDD